MVALLVTNKPGSVNNLRREARYMFSVPGFLMGIVRISLFMNINDQGVLVGVRGETSAGRTSKHWSRSTGMRMWLDQEQQYPDEQSSMRNPSHFCCKTIITALILVKWVRWSGVRLHRDQIPTILPSKSCDASVDQYSRRLDRLFGLNHRLKIPH